MKTYLKDLWVNPSSARKFFLALLGAVVLAGSHGLLPTAIAGWVSVVGPFIIAGGVYAVPNADTPNEYFRTETFE